MSTESHVDGNVLGGMLVEMFGAEMTDRRGCCGGCGAINPMGSMHVYVDAPGEVMRCPACEAVLVVLSHVQGAEPAARALPLRPPHHDEVVHAHGPHLDPAP